VLDQACDDLVASGKIPVKNLSFIAAVPGGGSLIDAVLDWASRSGECWEKWCQPQRCEPGRRP
jgi:hypothetical protein